MCLHLHQTDVPSILRRLQDDILWRSESLYWIQICGTRDQFVFLQEIYPKVYTLLTIYYPEIVLSMLLRNFRFSFGDKKIIWKMNGLNQPITEDAELDEYGLPLLQMPLRVIPLSES